MQLSFQEAFQKATQKTKSLITQEDLNFVKSQYKKEKSGSYILYAHYIAMMKYDKPEISKKVNSLLKRGIGHYTPLSGHTIPSSLID